MPKANAVNPHWCPWFVFLTPWSQTLTFLLKQLSLLVILQRFGHLQPRAEYRTLQENSVYLCTFIPNFGVTYFHVRKVAVLLEEGAKKVLNLASLQWSTCADEHSRLLNCYSKKYLFCVITSNEQLVSVGEAGRAEWGDACEQQLISYWALGVIEVYELPVKNVIGEIVSAPKPPGDRVLQRASNSAWGVIKHPFKMQI